jgi:hypothetical protein
MRKSVSQKEHLWEIIRLKASLAAFVGDLVTRPMKRSAVMGAPSTSRGINARLDKWVA